MSASAPAVSPGPATPQQQQLVVPPAPAAAASAEPPARDIDPNEVAGFIRRAQDLLTTGDLQAARLLLLRAAEAHDSRAALILAKTFDPIMSKPFGGADPEPDLAQARRWYQKADEWGAPEAQRQLDALASYSR
jgi:TPR repeat protein